MVAIIRKIERRYGPVNTFQRNHYFAGRTQQVDCDRARAGSTGHVGARAFEHDDDTPAKIPHLPRVLTNGTNSEHSIVKSIIVSAMPDLSAGKSPYQQGRMTHGNATIPGAC